MSDTENGDISNRAEVVRNWEDFQFKYREVCTQDEYDEATNPDGFINLGTAVNNMCHDIILPRLTSPDVWHCDPDLLQYNENYGIPKLRKALAAVMTEFFETHEPVDPENPADRALRVTFESRIPLRRRRDRGRIKGQQKLFCTVGVTACMDIIAHCLADPEDVILSPSPIYGRVFTNIMQRAQVNLMPIPVFTKEESETPPVLTLEKVKKAYEDAIAKTLVVKAIFLINPHNPLGEIYTPELLLEIFTFCSEHNLHVIVDEIYALSTFEGSPEFHSTLKFPDLPNKEKVHVLYGISKDFGIAGLRVGVIHTQNKALQNCLKQLSIYQVIPFPIMDIIARFIEDLEWCKSYFAENKKRLTERYNYCANRLEEMGLQIYKSTAGFFLWVDFKSICGNESFEQETDFFNYLMENAKVFIVPGKESFCEQPGWFRITYTSNSNYVDKGLERIEKAIRSYKRKDSVTAYNSNSMHVSHTLL